MPCFITWHLNNNCCRENCPHPEQFPNVPVDGPDERDKGTTGSLTDSCFLTSFLSTPHLQHRQNENFPRLKIPSTLLTDPFLLVPCKVWLHSACARKPCSHPSPFSETCRSTEGRTQHEETYRQNSNDPTHPTPGQSLRFTSFILCSPYFNSLLRCTTYSPTPYAACPELHNLAPNIYPRLSSLYGPMKIFCSSKNLPILFPILAFILPL